jgi:predicted DNA-binding transcriptional regulator YafY
MGRPKGASQQTLRAIRLLRRLDRGERICLYGTAEELGVSDRTLSRDIRVLREAGEKVVRRGDKFWIEAKAKDVTP